MDKIKTICRKIVEDIPGSDAARPKSLALEKRKMERELRAAGWSISQAKAEVSKHFRRHA